MATEAQINYLITNKNKLSEVRYILEYRKEHYKKLLDEGKIDAHYANYKIAVMKSIVADYERVTATGQESLFGS